MLSDNRHCAFLGHSLPAGTLPVEGLDQCDVQGFIRRTSANMYTFRVAPALAADGSVATDVDYSLLITLRSVDGSADL